MVEFLGPWQTLAESAAGPLKSTGKVHMADLPEVRQNSTRICGRLESAHLIAMSCCSLQLSETFFESAILNSINISLIFNLKF